jgi:hypothetical protein
MQGSMNPGGRRALTDLPHFIVVVGCSLFFNSSHQSSTAFYVHPPDQPGAKKPRINPKTINPTMTTAAATTANTRREGFIFRPSSTKVVAHANVTKAVNKAAGASSR